MYNEGTYEKILPETVSGSTLKEEWEGARMKQILLVSHCLLNTASKVKGFKEEAMEKEEALRRQFRPVFGQGQVDAFLQQALPVGREKSGPGREHCACPHFMRVLNEKRPCASARARAWESGHAA